MDPTRYKLFALSCALVVLAYCAVNLYQALRERSAAKRANLRALTRNALAPSSFGAGVVSSAIVTERAERVRLATDRREAA